MHISCNWNHFVSLSYWLQLTVLSWAPFGEHASSVWSGAFMPTYFGYQPSWLVRWINYHYASHKIKFRKWLSEIQLLTLFAVVIIGIGVLAVVIICICSILSSCHSLCWTLNRVIHFVKLVPVIQCKKEFYSNVRWRSCQLLLLLPSCFEVGGSKIARNCICVSQCIFGRK
jgi:hypothetical protein